MVDAWKGSPGDFCPGPDCGRVDAVVVRAPEHAGYVCEWRVHRHFATEPDLRERIDNPEWFIQNPHSGVEGDWRSDERERLRVLAEPGHDFRGMMIWRWADFVFGLSVHSIPVYYFVRAFAVRSPYNNLPMPGVPVFPRLDWPLP